MCSRLTAKGALPPTPADLKGLLSRAAGNGNLSRCCMPYCIDPDYSFLHRVCQPYRVSAQVRMDRLCRGGPSHTKLAFASTNDLDRDSWDPTIRAPKGMGGASAPRLPHHASWVSRLPLWAQQGLARRTLPDSLAACAGGLPAHALLLASAPYTTRLEQDVVIAGGERHRARAPIPVRIVSKAAAFERKRGSGL